MQTTAMNEPALPLPDHLEQRSSSRRFCAAWGKGTSASPAAPSSPAASSSSPPSSRATTAGSSPACLAHRAARPLASTHRASGSRPPAAPSCCSPRCSLLRPVLWFAWNARQYGDWLDFMRGPYSAKAIDVRTSHAWLAPLSRLAQPSRRGAVLTSNRRNWARPRPLGESRCLSLHRRLRRRPCQWRKRCFSPFLLFWMPRPSTHTPSLGVRPHLHPTLVAPLLVQHPLRYGNAAHLRPFSGLPRCMADGSGGTALATTRPAHPAGRDRADPARLLLAHA